MESESGGACELLIEGERGVLFPKVADSPLDLGKLGREMLEFKARPAQSRSRRLFASLLS